MKKIELAGPRLEQRPAPLAMEGHFKPEGIWSLKSHPAWEQGGRGLRAHWTFFFNPTRAF